MAARTKDVFLEKTAYGILRKTAAKIAQSYPALLRSADWQSVAHESIAKEVQRYSALTLAEIQALWAENKFAYLYVAIERDFKDDIRKRGRQKYALSFGRDDAGTDYTAEHEGSEGTAIDRLSDRHTYETWRDEITEPDRQQIAESLEQAARSLNLGPKRVTSVLAELERNPERLSELMDMGLSDTAFKSAIVRNVTEAHGIQEQAVRKAIRQFQVFDIPELKRVPEILRESGRRPDVHIPVKTAPSAQEAQPSPLPDFEEAVLADGEAGESWADECSICMRRIGFHPRQDGYCESCHPKDRKLKY